MKQLAIRLTHNEIRLCTLLLPEGFNVRTLGNNATEDWRVLRDLTKLSDHGIKVNTFIRNALKSCSVVVVDPKTFSRIGNDDEANEANLPIKGTRKTIPLSDEEWEIIEETQLKYFRHKTITDTVVWMLYNYSAKLSMDPTLVTRQRKVKAAPSTANTVIVTLRLPEEIVTFAAVQAQAEGISVGRWLRETIISGWPMLKNGAELEPVSTDDFDYDLEDEL